MIGTYVNVVAILVGIPTEAWHQQEIRARPLYGDGARRTGDRARKCRQ